MSMPTSTAPGPATVEAGLLRSLDDWVEANWSPELSLREWWARLGPSGWGFPDWPADWFGRDLARSDAAAISRHLAESGVLGAPQGVGQLWGARTILDHGSDALKQQFLHALVTGQENWCQLFSEPSAGSDLASVATRAERVPGGWRITGDKVWTTLADESERAVLLARTDPSAPKREGLSYFVIDMRQPAVTTRPIVQMDGHARFFQVTLADAWVGDDRLVGQLHGGWSVARSTLMHERRAASQRRPTAVVAKPGNLGGTLDVRVGDLLELERQSERPAGHSLGSQSLMRLAVEQSRDRDPMVRHSLTEHFIVASVHKWNRARAQADAAAGRRSGAEESIAKLTIGRLARLSRDVGLSIMGAQGMLVRDGSILGRRVQEVALSSPSTSIAGGTDEIQRNLIAERVLGLPRDVDGTER
jgi:alkylation response protein AidB-like acyl-CoA dehydrogenase